MTEAELRALAWKIAEGKVVMSAHVPEQLWVIVFMPLLWMRRRHLEKHKDDVVYAIVGEDDQVSGRAVNGFPLFASCRFLPRQYWDRVNAFVEEAQAKKAAFLEPSSEPTGMYLSPTPPKVKAVRRPKKKKLRKKA